MRVVGEPVTADPPGRLIVLGVDGLPPEFLRQVVDAGRVPAFDRLFRGGAMGEVNVLRTRLPPLSPRIWTSFVTGQVPEVHGIRGFVHREEGEEILYDSTMRKSPAIWNIASQLGKKVGVVNWWATSPAEAVHGFMISDLYNDVAATQMANSLHAVFERDAARVVYPRSLVDLLAGLQPLKHHVGASVVRAEEVDANVMEMAVVALRAHPVDVFLVYTRAFDELSHMAWPTHEPLPGESPKRDLIVDYVERYDWLLERFLKLLGPSDHLMVLSDHGFERARKEKGRLGGTHESAKTANGVFLLYGPRIRRGVRLQRIDVLDVLPTMLELAGLPAAEDMPGRIAAAAFLPSERRFLPRVKSYELADGGSVGRRDSAGDDAMKERLRALGYLDD